MNWYITIKVKFQKKNRTTRNTSSTKKDSSEPRPKKSLGQHFLTDESIAVDIADALLVTSTHQPIIEIGPGTGALTHWLLSKYASQTHLIEVDHSLIPLLEKQFPALKDRIIHADFLKVSIKELFPETPISIIGNFPYNISSQIFFKVLEQRKQVQQVVCMLQKEVAKRIAAPPGSKTYGILSVLLQAHYDIEYLFDVPPEVFNPPPKVYSGVIRLQRNNVTQLDCNEETFIKIVKESFQKRRKTLRNALAHRGLSDKLKKWELLDKRAEQLSVNDFIALTQAILNQ